MSKIALFGGAFDPPTIAHAPVITQLLNSTLVDQVWLVPSGERTDKKYHVPMQARRRMLSEMVRELYDASRVRIEALQIEQKLPSGSFTVELLRHLALQYPEHQFYWVIGQDLVHQIANWKEGAWLAENTNFIVVERVGEQVKETSKSVLKHALYLQQDATCSISSTKVRALVEAGKSIAGLVPEIVAKIIVSDKLYYKNPDAQIEIDSK